jgi:cytochrome c
MRANVFSICCIITLVLASSSLVIAEDTATKDECMAKVAGVIQVINQQSAQAAIAQVNDVNGPFVWKDTYVYIMDLSGNIVAHGPQPKFIGKNLMGLKDPVTKQPWYPALFEKIKAADDSKGWFDYHWKKPNAEGIYKKECYYERAGDLVVFAGIYSDKVQ